MKIGRPEVAGRSFPLCFFLHLEGLVLRPHEARGRGEKTSAKQAVRRSKWRSTSPRGGGSEAQLSGADTKRPQPHPCTAPIENAPPQEGARGFRACAGSAGAGLEQAEPAVPLSEAREKRAARELGLWAGRGLEGRGLAVTRSPAPSSAVYLREAATAPVRPFPVGRAGSASFLW